MRICQWEFLVMKTNNSQALYIPLFFSFFVWKMDKNSARLCLWQSGLGAGQRHPKSDLQLLLRIIYHLHNVALQKVYFSSTWNFLDRIVLPTATNDNENNVSSAVDYFVSSFKTSATSWEIPILIAHWRWRKNGVDRF